MRPRRKKKIHSHFSQQRYGKEFFKVETPEAIAIIQTKCSILHEDIFFKSNEEIKIERQKAEEKKRQAELQERLRRNATNNNTRKPSYSAYSSRSASKLRQNTLRNSVDDTIDFLREFIGFYVKFIGPLILTVILGQLGIIPDGLLIVLFLLSFLWMAFFKG